MELFSWVWANLLKKVSVEGTKWDSWCLYVHTCSNSSLSEYIPHTLKLLYAGFYKIDVWALLKWSLHKFFKVVVLGKGRTDFQFLPYLSTLLFTYLTTYLSASSSKNFSYICTRNQFSSGNHGVSSPHKNQTTDVAWVFWFSYRVHYQQLLNTEGWELFFAASKSLTKETTGICTQ